MAFEFLRRWGARQLVAALSTYWVALALVVVGSPAMRFWRLTHDPASHGNASAGIRNDVIWATVAENGATAWVGSAHMVTLVMWLVGPPLVLYIVWLRSRPSPQLPRRTASVRGDRSGILTSPPSELGAGEAPRATDFVAGKSARSSIRGRRDRAG
ncbi:MAG: hypothetical protein M3R65_08445 [Gemmatimonadota bacterium]|nr:hypothetical protein [Gemmatimonadota bacterium]